MEQYIKKSDLVAELERRKQVAFGWMETAPNDAIEAEFELCDDILSFLDALEVKEMDSNDAFIEKAAEWLEPVFKNYAGYNCGIDLVEDFKNYTEGE